jgi:hypothetical protein
MYLKLSYVSSISITPDILKLCTTVLSPALVTLGRLRDVLAFLPPHLGGVDAMTRQTLNG